MKNYWLDKKEEREFSKNLDAACCEMIVGEFLDSDFIDATTIHVGNDRYKDSNFTITVGAELPVSMNKKSEYGEICGRCGEEMWPLNTATSMTQGDPMCACHNGDSCNLDIFYPDRFIQSETLQVLDSSKHGVTVFQTMFTPVLPGSMSGTINWTHEGFNYASFSFTVDINGKLDVTRTGPDGKPVPTVLEGGTLDLYYDEIYAWESSLNCQTGVLEVHWHSSEHPNNVTVSYEYNKEV